MVLIVKAVGPDMLRVFREEFIGRLRPARNVPVGHSRNFPAFSGCVVEQWKEDVINWAERKTKGECEL